MDAQTIIAKRIARELREGMLVNLGIGIPTLVANYVPDAMHVFFQSENGLITGPVPQEGWRRRVSPTPAAARSRRCRARAPSTARCRSA